MLGLRHRVNLFVYENRNFIRKFMGWLMALSSIVMVASMIYYHGFVHTEAARKVLLDVNRAFFGIFIINFLLRLFFEPDRKSFLRSARFEAVLLSLVVLNFISFQLFRYPIIARLLEALNFEGFEPYYVFFIQCYLLLLIVLHVLKSVPDLGKLKIKPTTIFLISFVLLILTGSLLLSLPTINSTGQQLRYLDALFTATSASCVTGLTVMDTATFFNTKGQLIILLLFQVGGLGMVSFATFFASFVKKGVGLKHQSMLKELFDSESLLGSVSLLRKIVVYTLTIELVSVILIYNFWGDYPFSSNGQKLFFSIFHGVSAFCNAGFSLFTSSLYEIEIRTNYLLHMVIAVTIFFGSLGFPAIRDIFETSNVIERLRKPWKHWKLSTQIAVKASLVLVVFGAAMFYFLEANGVLAEMEIMPRIFTSIFHAVSTRTAGFNTVDFAQLGVPILIIIVFLMFIGSSSGSTGGGIKTSTFVVIFAAIVATVRGRREVTFGRRTISGDLIYKAFSILVFSALYIFISFFALTIAEPHIPATDLLFEEVSAFTTTGLSTGITAGLSDFSKCVLIASMFIGRIGILSLAFSLSIQAKSNSYKYPNSHIMIG